MHEQLANPNYCLPDFSCSDDMASTTITALNTDVQHPRAPPPSIAAIFVVSVTTFAATTVSTTTTAPATEQETLYCLATTISPFPPPFPRN
nr:unnamed protein product [Spirometra erinaceieuropaei]